MEKYRIAFINIFFGPFPPYFNLFLDSCARNSSITWHIYTDNEMRENWPANVIYHRTSLGMIKQRFQEKFDYPIILDSPKKLCDYKPLYGYLLEEDMKPYDFWGHCDLDLIWGRIHLEESLLDHYDKLYTLGHFTLYRNCPECNRYLLTYRNGLRVKEVLQSKFMEAFDEWGPENVNDIFRRSNLRFYAGTIGADIWPESQVFKLSEYHEDGNRYYPIRDSNGIVYVNQEGMFYLYQDGRKEEVGYVHLQKRAFTKFEADPCEAYYILQDGFYSADRLPEGGETENTIIKKGCRSPFIDRQFLKIKRINLRNRLKRLWR